MKETVSSLGKSRGSVRFTKAKVAQVNCILVFHHTVHQVFFLYYTQMHIFAFCAVWCVLIFEKSLKT